MKKKKKKIVLLDIRSTDFKLLIKIFLDLFKIDSFNYGKAEILTTAHDIDRSYLLDGKYYSPVIDTIEDDIYKLSGKKCISIARIISVVKGDKAYGTVYSPEGSFARALILKRIKGKLNKKKYPYSHLEEKTWGKILDGTGAKKVFGIQPSREMCVACHKRGIWVADVQHGVIGSNNHWYGKSYRGHEPKEWIPDSFLVWDKEASDEIQEWSLEKGIDAQIVGNRWLARFRNISDDDILVRKAIEKIDNYFQDKIHKPVILVTLSWGPLAHNGEIPPTILKTIYKTHSEYQWLIRLHPNQINGWSTNEYDKFLEFHDKNLKGLVEWELATFSPLPAVLAKTDLHVSWLSSVAIEASQLGIKSALLDPVLTENNSIQFFKYYHDLGMINFIKDDELIVHEWIKNNIGYRSQTTSYNEHDANYRDFLNFIIS